MATEIGTAYLSIVASTKGMGRDIAKAYGAAEGEGEKSGKKSGKGFLGGIGQIIAKGATLIGIGAVAGTAISKGLSRAISIEDAQAKLTGLGHDSASVAAIMKNALASVKGTSFGLGEAATTAAGAVAAGIKPGADLERVLKSVSNSAAAAGIDMGSMGSIFNKVASIGKAQNDSLQQVADRGIPIYQALADQLGVTTDQVFKMASAGKIGFADFEKAMTTAAGSVAFEMGNTFTGTLKNVNAALGRLGAAFLTPALAAAKPILRGVISLVDALTEAVTPAAVALGKLMLPAAERVGAAMSVLGGQVGAVFELLRTGDFNANLREKLGLEEDSQLVDVILRIREALTGGAGDAATFWTAVKSGTLSEAFGSAAPLIETVAALSPLAIAAKSLVPVLPQLASAFGQVVTALLPAVPALASVAATLGVQLAQAVAVVVPALLPIVVALAQLAGTLASNEPLLYAVVGAFAAFKTVSAVKSVVSDTMKAVDAGTQAWGVFSTALGGAQRIAAKGDLQMKAMKAGMIGHKVATAVATAAQWLWNAAMTANPIGIVIVAIAALVAALVWFFTQTEVGREAWAGFIGWLGDAWNGLAKGATDLWAGIVSGATAAVEGASAAWQGVVQGASDAWAAVVGGANAAASGVAAGWATFVGWITDLWNGVVGVASEVWGAVAPIITAPFLAVSEVVGAVFETIKSVVAAAFLVVVGIFTGDGALIESATSALGARLSEIWTSALDAIQGLVGAALSTVQGFFTAAWDAITGAAVTAWNTLSQAVLTGVDQAVVFVSELPGKTVAALSSLGAQIAGLASQAWASFTAAVSSGISSAISFVRELPGRALAALGSLGGIITDVAQRAWASFTAAVSSGISSAISFVRELPGRALAALGSIGSALTDAGRQMIAGFIRGVTGAAAGLARAVKDTIGGAISAAKSVLGIQSPSRVFATIGDQTGAGLVLGLNRMAGPVADAAAGMLAGIETDIDPFAELSARSLGAFADRAGLDIQARFDAVATRIPRPDLDTAPAGADRVEVLLQRLIAAVEAGQVIDLDGDRLVGATSRRMSQTLNASQEGSSRANGSAGLVV